jgi:hypothetical protein
MDLLLSTLLIGAGATAATDIWAVLRKKLFGVAMPSWGLVGRWIVFMPQGQFRHAAIASAPAVNEELLIGWLAHYAIGIGFAALLVAICGHEWLLSPTAGPALLLGISTVLAPFLVMQPGMGAGIAASRTPRPGAARLQSLITHTIFGLGLYAAGWLNNSLNQWSMS